MEDVDIIFESWLEKQEWSSNKTKGLFKRASAKPAWKKYYFVLKRHNDRDQSFLHWFEKEEQRSSNQSKGYFELTPKIFKIFKKGEDKGKYIFELTNDSLMCRLSADGLQLLDLWVIQLQMLVRLNPRIAGRLFPVKGGSTKDMSRIGAKSQSLLLHVSKWGVTVALEKTAAVLAQWPLTTIRNYESTDNDEFAFESGRKSPMGEGKYNFLTRNREDNVIFDTIDDFTQQRLDAKKLQRQGSVGSTGSCGTGQSRESLEEEEINKTYDMLRFSVQAIPNTVIIDEPPAAAAAAVKPSEPRNINGASSTAMYNHLGRSNSVSHNNSSSGDSSLERSGDFLGFPERSASLGSYNHLDPICSWNSCRSTAPLLRPDSYDHLSIGSEASSYDRLAPSRSMSRSGNFSTSRMKELSPDEVENVMRTMPGCPVQYEQPGGGHSMLGSPEIDRDPDYPDRPLPQIPQMLPQATKTEDRLGLPSSRPRMPSPSSIVLEEDPEQDYMSMANKASFVFLNNAFSGSADNLAPNIIQNPTYSPTKHKKTKSQENISRLDTSIVLLRRSRSEEDFLDGATMRANAVSLGSTPATINPGSNPNVDNLMAAAVPGAAPDGSSLPYRNSNERIRSLFRLKKKTGKGKEKTKDISKKKQKGKTNADHEEGTIYAEIPGQSEGNYNLPYDRVNGGKMKLRSSVEEFEMVSQRARSVSPDRSLPSPGEDSGFVVVDAQYSQIGSKA